MATLKSRKIHPHLNQDSIVQLDSGQNSKATLKIRIKIEKHRKMQSSRSSRDKSSLTGTLDAGSIALTPE